jgi:hypothetical protein
MTLMNKKQGQHSTSPGKTHAELLMVRSDSEDNTTVQSIPTVKASNVHLHTYESSDGSTLSSCSKHVRARPSTSQQLESSPTTSTRSLSWFSTRRRKRDSPTKVNSGPSLVSKLSHLLFSKNPKLNTVTPEPWILSSNTTTATTASIDKGHPVTYEYLDRVIQRQWDGIDILSLGVAYRPRVLANNLQHGYEPIGQVLVSNSLYHNHLGYDSQYPVVVMDGYQPSGEDRWSVYISPRDETLEENQIIYKVELDPFTLEDETEPHFTERMQDATLDLPLFLLLSQMQKRCLDPLKASSQTKQRQPSNVEQFFPPCSSCPMDVDEDVFLIESLDHLKNVYNVVADHLEVWIDIVVEINRWIFVLIVSMHDEYIECRLGSSSRGYGKITS